MSLTSRVKCPYCKHIYSEGWFTFDDDFEELECSICNKSFFAEVELNVTTKKMPYDRVEPKDCKHEHKEIVYEEDNGYGKTYYHCDECDYSWSEYK